MRFETANPIETKKIGEALGSLLKEGAVLLINGDLGAGKTTFIQGLALGLGIKADVTSPTFTIIHEYPGATPLYHIDAYRLERDEEILELGLEEYFYGNGVTAIEWAEKIASWLPQETVDIYLKKIDGHDGKREIFFNKDEKENYRKLIEEAIKIADISN